MNEFAQYNKYMDYLKEYNERKKIDEIVWKSLPTTLGYWSWLVTTIYLWHFRSTEIDISAAAGLGIGVLVWTVSKVLLLAVGINLIHMNLWDNYGCGCLAKMIAIPLLPYVSMLILSVWAYRSGSINLLVAVAGSVIIWFDWFLLSYLDTYIDLRV